MENIIFINGRFLTQKLTGSQRNSYELAKELINIYDGKLIILVPNKKINESFDITNFPLKHIGKRAGVLWEQVELPLFLYKNKKPLLINLTNTAPFVYQNQIVSIMDMTTFINPKWFSKSFALYYKWLIPKIAKRAKKVITISENSKKDIVKYTRIPHHKIKVITCAVSDTFVNFVADDDIKKSLLLRLEIKEKKFLLAVSSLDPRKNFVTLIHAYLQTGLKDYPLVIVGSSGKAFNNPEIEKFKNTPEIKFTGYLSDIELAAIYSMATCFLYPSLYEGFGIPPLEAMACGCSTIVSNTSSLPEVCGDASLYIDPFDMQTITSAIHDIVSDDELRNDLIKKGNNQIKKYSWKKSAEQLAKEIDILYI